MIEVYTLWNIYTFYLIVSDKKKSRKGQRRIPERTLFLTASCFGAAGILLGMYIVRHKTRHWSFIVGMPVLLLLNIAILYWLTGY